MLFQPTNVIPDEKSGLGLGVFDVSDGMQISWQVNGDYPVMTAFRISIYQRNAASTLLYDTGRLTNNCPFYGTDALGNAQFFTYTIPNATLTSHGISNGGEYKYTIRQYYMENGSETSIAQSSASTFVTRATPSFSAGTIPNPLTSSEYTFTASYSQAQGDTLNWIRYRIAILGDLNNPIYDSHNLYGAAVFQTTYSGFFTNTAYAIRITGQTSSGVEVDTGWETFNVSYSVLEPTGAIVASVWKGHAAVLVDWRNTVPVTGQTKWRVYRRTGDAGILTKIAELPISETKLYDFGVASGQGAYTYYLFPASNSAVIGSPLTSNETNPCFYQWTLLSCSKRNTSGADAGYQINAEYHFRYNLDSGAVSNNNTPGILQNFTEKPTIQSAPQNYLSGTLTALSGAISKVGEYNDTLTLRKAIMALSVTSDVLILKSSKGDVKYIRIAGNITASTAENTKSLAQTVNVPWVEEDDAVEAPIYALAIDSIIQNS